MSKQFRVFAVGVVVTCFMAYYLVSTHATPSTQPSENAMVTVRVIQEDGSLSEPVQQNKVVKTDADWQKILTPEQFRVVRSAGTERPFCSGFLRNKEPGMYLCVACNLPLFDSTTKFESGTGWPSFYRPAVKENVAEKEDRSHGMVRTEVNCTRCDGHLGHVFNDGPKPTGLRYCMNGESLKFVKTDDLKTLAEKGPTTQPAK